MLCGESNIINTKRKGSPEYVDNFKFLEKLNHKGIKIILNPIHDFMRRYEMKKKRAKLDRKYFSGDRNGKEFAACKTYRLCLYRKNAVTRNGT